KLGTGTGRETAATLASEASQEKSALNGTLHCKAFSVVKRKKKSPARSTNVKFVNARIPLLSQEWRQRDFFVCDVLSNFYGKFQKSFGHIAKSYILISVN
ncbi:MAG: hypothetical protein PHH16_04055, partial [Candidatus Gracilibacteria bacterium]|nr:hypothetical protein [Candidatus Gracilibacteria bacterium]